MASRLCHCGPPQQCLLAVAKICPREELRASLHLRTSRQDYILRALLLSLLYLALSLAGAVAVFSHEAGSRCSIRRLKFESLFAGLHVACRTPHPSSTPKSPLSSLPVGYQRQPCSPLSCCSNVYLQ